MQWLATLTHSKNVWGLNPPSMDSLRFLPQPKAMQLVGLEN